MTAVELANLVLDMRHAQKTYFRTQSQTALTTAKQLEKKVDRCCAIVLQGQKELFPEDRQGGRVRP